MWLVLGLAGVVAAVAADRLVAGVPAAPIATPRRVARVPLPPDVRRLVASYACAGFGYVITATYIVLIVRESDLGRWLEVLTWCVVGAWSAISTWLVARIGAVTGDRRALVIAHGLQAAGVLSVAFVPGTAGVLVGATLLGATFAGITGVGVDLAGRMHPADPTRAIAVMTTAFAVGQMIGPALGGWLADRTGTFRVPSVLAAVVLLAGGAILLARSAQREPEDVRVTA
jgi:predicted MFS family arabinose efflux permease